MTTILNANNSGITQTVDASGVLQLQTANTAAITIDTIQNITCNSTGAITVSAGTTAQRPASPANGMLRYNSTIAGFEVYANNTWAVANVTPPAVNTVAPVISGSAVVGQTLTSTTGTWSNSPTSYGYQWRANAVSISANSTANTFVLTLTENGANITCNVTAINPAGNSTPATSNTLGPVTNTYTVSYLVVAGGGPGGSVNTMGGGGGGAGGYKTSTASFTPGTVYTATVGGGGSLAGPNNNGSNGSNSALSGTGLTTVTSTGGGFGGYGRGGGLSSGGNSGGSGGGGGGEAGSGGTGTSGQGNNGGNATSGGPNYTAGGGGGAGSAGGTGSNGSGSASSITGSSVTYAAGGTGGNTNVTGQQGASGAANTGNGGNGSDGSGGGDLRNGSNGGSGIVILSVPTASYSGTTTGSPTITTSGSNTILKFTGSGTYTA